MKEEEWLQRMKNDDASELKRWQDTYAERMTLFVFQFGCTLEQARELVEAECNKIDEHFNQLENEEQLLLLYKMIVEKLTSMQLTASVSSDVLPFEEDEQLHQQISGMRNEWKLPFILSRFHDMDTAEIAMIMGTSTEHIEQAVASAYQQLDLVYPDKQLSFLQKSYQRIHLTWHKDSIDPVISEFVQTVTSSPLPQQQAIAKKPLYLWLVGIIVLIGLVIFSVVTSEDYQQKSREKYVKRLQTSFEKEVEQKLEVLGLVEEDLQDISHYYDADGEFKGTIRDQFDALITELDQQLEQGKKLNKSHIQQQYEQIVEQMELPSEMAQRLLAAPITANREISLAFMERYTESILLMQQAYFTKVLGYDEPIGNSFSDTTFDAEKFYNQQATFPEDLQRALIGMEGQNLRLKSMEGWGIISPLYVKNNFSAQLRNSLHPDVQGYITVLESQPFIHYQYQEEEDEYVASLAYSLEESVEFIVEMEKSLLVTTSDGLLYQQSVMNYFSLLCEITACEQTDRAFDASGQVKKELQTAWRKLAENGKDSPAAVIVQQIIPELELTDWTASESLSRLQSEHFFNALNLASEGKLKSFTIEEIEEIEMID